MSCPIAVYTLYKHPVQNDTLAIVQYCHSKGINVIPVNCIERNHNLPEEELPAVFDHTSNTLFKGLSHVVGFYESLTGIPDILKHALKFKSHHPEYRIHN